MVYGTITANYDANNPLENKEGALLHTDSVKGWTYQAGFALANGITQIGWSSGGAKSVKLEKTGADSVTTYDYEVTHHVWMKLSPEGWSAKVYIGDIAASDKKEDGGVKEEALYTVVRISDQTSLFPFKDTLPTIKYFGYIEGKSQLDNVNLGDNDAAKIVCDVGYVEDPVVQPDGIFEPVAKTFSFGPNPIVDVLTFDSEKEMDIEIYSLTGQSLLNFKNVRSEIDLSGLNSGMYLLRAIDALGNEYTTKFVKK